MKNYPFYGITNRRNIIFSYWITSEMVIILTRDRLCQEMIEEGSERARFNEMMKLSPEEF